MKAVYMMLSGLILSLGVTVAMAGLLSISSLTKSNTKIQEQFTEMLVSESNTHKAQSVNDHYDTATETDIYKDCYALNSGQINKVRDNKKRQSN